jgi:GGDEF domain-containing protein
VVTHAADPRAFGHRYAIPSFGTLDVGSMGCELLLTGDADVAPKHVTFEWRDADVFVTPHAPNVLLDGAPIRTPHRVTAGARIDVGGSVLTVIAGERMEAQYHEVVYTLTMKDAVTGLFNRRMLTAHWDKSVDDGRGGSVAAFEIDAPEGPFDKNRTLERASRWFSAQVEDRVLARTGPTTFEVLCAGASTEDAETWARDLVARAALEGVSADLEGVRAVVAKIP